MQPETTKIHAIIEKTAKFISTQGPQMEILIKAKQANNSLFEFLNQNSRLNPFYKHTLQAMKDGNYPADGGQAPAVDTENNGESPGSIFQSYYNSSANQPNVSLISKLKSQLKLNLFSNFIDSCACSEIQTISRLCVYTTNQ